MQILREGDNLQETVKFYCLGKIRQKKFKMSSAEILTQHAKR